MRFLLIDDHSLFREGLVQLIRRVRRGAQVLQAGTLAEGLKLAAQAPAPDLVLLDVMLPDCQGLQGIKEFKKRFVKLPVLLISAYEEPALQKRALALGAAGFLAKSANSVQMEEAMKRALGLSEKKTELTQKGGPEALTGRQMEVLGLLVRGMSNPQIGRELGIAHSTVRVHMLAIFKVLGVASRTQAALLAVKQGLLHAQR